MKLLMGWLLFGIVFNAFAFECNWKLVLVIIVLSTIVGELIRRYYRKKGVKEEDLYLEDSIRKWLRKRDVKHRQPNDY